MVSVPLAPSYGVAFIAALVGHAGTRIDGEGLRPTMVLLEDLIASLSAHSNWNHRIIRAMCDPPMAAAPPLAALPEGEPPFDKLPPTFELPVLSAPEQA